MPMWAHYASNHKGFCVSYDMKTNIKLSSITFSVQYTDERLDVTSLMGKYAIYVSNEVDRQGALGRKEIVLDDLMIVLMQLLLCNIKHSSWSYEKEFRCTAGATAKGMPFVEAMPKEIYIGMNCELNHAQRLKEIGESWNIPVYKMAFNECGEKYELIANRAG